MATLNFTYKLFLGSAQIAELDGQAEVCVGQTVTLDDIRLLDISTDKYTAIPGSSYSKFSPVSSADIEAWLWANRAEKIDDLADEERALGVERAA